MWYFKKSVNISGVLRRCILIHSSKPAGTPEGEPRVSGSKAFQGLVVIRDDFWILKVPKCFNDRAPLTTRILGCLLCCRELRYWGEVALQNKDFLDSSHINLDNSVPLIRKHDSAKERCAFEVSVSSPACAATFWRESQ